jgi:hypothetical protein
VTRGECAITDRRKPCLVASGRFGAVQAAPVGNRIERVNRKRISIPKNLFTMNAHAGAMTADPLAFEKKVRHDAVRPAHLRIRR